MELIGTKDDTILILDKEERNLLRSALFVYLNYCKQGEIVDSVGSGKLAFKMWRTVDPTGVILGDLSFLDGDSHGND